MAVQLNRAAIRKLTASYQERWGLPLCAVDARGRFLYGRWACEDKADRACTASRQKAIESAARWGECTILLCHSRTLIWAVPLMRNAEIIAGLVASVSQRRVFPDGGGDAAFNTRAACADLRVLAEQYNLTNAAFLQVRREQYAHERELAEVVQEFKASPYDNILEMYLRTEGELIAAIRRDDRGKARQIINGMLVAMLSRSGESFSLAKTFFLQLIVTMCRAAVEAGGKPEELLGANFQSLQELSEIQSDEQLGPWLRRVLEHVMDAIRDTPGRPASAPIAAALEFMEQNLEKDIGRDEIARAAHLSPYHFSRLFKQHVGQSCKETLIQKRVNHAAWLLVRSDKPLFNIAMDSGFRDPSYFTKVFRRYMGTTPKAYRVHNHRKNSTL